MTIIEVVWIVLGVILFAFLVLTISGLYFYNYSIKRSKKDFIVTDEDLMEVFNHLGKAKEWLNEQEVGEQTITTPDRLTLSAKYVKASKETNRFVVLVHGYMSSSEDMAGFAWLFHKKYNFNVLMPDLRGHGRSEGKYIGFGYHDRLDVLQWINAIIEQYGEDSQIAVLGISMGGATVSFLSGETLPPQVKFIISDCAYDSIKGILKYQMRRIFGLPSFPLLNVTSLVTKLRAGYSFENKEIKDYVKKSQVPMLFIHGGSDAFVPTRMVYSLYNACPTSKRLLIIKGAAHGAAHPTDPAIYEMAIEEFIEQFMN